MDAADRKRSFAIHGGNASFGRAASSRQCQAICRARCKRANRDAAAANELAGAEADALALGQQLPERGARRMVDDHLFGITDRKTGACASLAEFIVAARLQPLVETTDGVEHRTTNEQVGGGAEALPHIAALPEETAGVDEFGRGRRGGQFEVHATGNTRDGREHGEALFEPVRARRAVDVGEGDVFGAGRVQAGIARRIRTQGTVVDQQMPARQKLLPEPGLSCVIGPVVDPDHLDGVLRILLTPERVGERAQVCPRVAERDDDRDQWRHSAFRQPVPYTDRLTEPFPPLQLPKGVGRSIVASYCIRAQINFSVYYLDNSRVRCSRDASSA
jgi:hypothetical protein